MRWKAAAHAVVLAYPVSANAEPDQDCRIRLEFSSDDVGAVVKECLINGFASVGAPA